MLEGVHEARERRIRRVDERLDSLEVANAAMMEDIKDLRSRLGMCVNEKEISGGGELRCKELE